MNNRARLLTTSLLAIATTIATVIYGQTVGLAQAPGAVQGGAGAAGQAGQPQAQLAYDFNDHEGWKQVFDGRTLNGWDGSKNVWRVEDGAIVGESTVEHPTIWNVNGNNTGTAWLILNGKLKNFAFKTEVKLEGRTNSGIFFRATRLGAIPDDVYAEQLKKRIPEGGPTVRPNGTAWEVRGYEADYAINPNGNLGDCCNGPQRGVGQIEFGHNPLPPRRPGGAPRGMVTLSSDGGKRELIGTIGDPKDLASKFTPTEWTQVEVIASGNVFLCIINGQLMSVWVDVDQKFGNPEGEIAVEVEGQGNVKAMFRNMWLKTLP
jgi:hypothetical protein